MKRIVLILGTSLCVFFLIPAVSTAQTLALAVQAGDTSQLNQLIASGANVNQADSNGTTPLMLACSLGDTLMANDLIANGASVNLADNHLNTALSISSMDAYIDLVNLLLAAGADPTQKVGSMRPYDLAIEAKAAKLQNEAPRNSGINQQASILVLGAALGY